MLADSVVLIIFLLVYIGMATGRLPGLNINRTGMAMIGAILLVVFGIVPFAELPVLLELPTLLMLLALMLLGAHFTAAHSFAALAHWLSHRTHRPRSLLAGVIVSSGVLSMVLVNDIVVFAFTPVLCLALSQQKLDPRPYLLGLAGAANAGSAASLIGNPQNILIGQIGQLSLADYFLLTIVPVSLALFMVYWVISRVWKSHFMAKIQVQTWACETRIDRWLLTKSLSATVLLVVLLLSFPAYRPQIALALMGLLLSGRSLRAATLFKEIDWALLLLISGLFVVTSAFSQLAGTQTLESYGWLPDRLAVLLPFSVIASNTIGNVPAVLLLLNVTENLSTVTLQGLALFSTLSGNLLLTGSLANIIVAERAASQGVRLGFMDFLRVGIPITLLSLLPAALWFYLMTEMTW